MGQQEQMKIQQQQEEQMRIQQQEEEARAAAEMRRQQEEAERQRQEQMQRQQQEEQMRIQQQQEEQMRIQRQQEGLRDEEEAATNGIPAAISVRIITVYSCKKDRNLIFKRTVQIRAQRKKTNINHKTQDGPRSSPRRI